MSDEVDDSAFEHEGAAAVAEAAAESNEPSDTLVEVSEGED